MRTWQNRLQEDKSGSSGSLCEKTKQKQVAAVQSEKGTNRDGVLHAN
jgi:hypothetical protein